MSQVELCTQKNEKNIYTEIVIRHLLQLMTMPVPLNRKLTEEEDAALRDSLKRCSEETIQAAIAYREKGEIEHVPVIVEGIAERFLEPDMRPVLKDGDDNLRIFEDLGIDSLTMVEVVMLVEEILDISIENEELRDLRTIGDVKKFIDYKVRGLPIPENKTHIAIEKIIEVMPHTAPFLFLQEATIQGDEISGLYKISGDEYFLEGHFKDRPVFPASIMIEALGQLGVLFLLCAKTESIENAVNPNSIYFTSCDGIRAQRVCQPGDLLRLHMKPKRIRHPLATFEGTITTESEKVAFAEEITLTFDYQAEA